MTSLTAWAGGSLDAGSIGFQAAFGTEINSLAGGACVLSTISFDNTTGLDQFMDISFKGAYLTAATMPVGLSIGFFMAIWQGDGTTIGDGRLTPGTQVAGTVYQPIMNPLGGFQLATNTATSTPIIGDVGGVVLRPRKFSLIIQNNASYALADCGYSFWISSYRQNMNA